MSRLTTLGVTFGYGVETEKGVKPTTFKQLELASSIGGISLDTEQIDVSALEDYITKYAANDKKLSSVFSDNSLFILS